MTDAPPHSVIDPQQCRDLSRLSLTPMGNIKKPLRRWNPERTRSSALPLSNPGRLAGWRSASIQDRVTS